MTRFVRWSVCVCTLLVPLVAAAGMQSAGPNVKITVYSPTNVSGSGHLAAARNSADTKQQIGCYVTAQRVNGTTSTFSLCEFTDANGNYWTCEDTDYALTAYHTFVAHSYTADESCANHYVRVFSDDPVPQP